MDQFASLLAPGSIGSVHTEGPSNSLHLPWLTTSSVKQYTLVFPIITGENKICLGLKKRGFGVGRYNGFGGKVEPGETVLDAAKRELLEEANITAIKISSCGRMYFAFENSPVLMDVHVYRIEEWEQEPEETEEMLPKWHSTLPAAQAESVFLPSIPFDNMWPDDELWFPLFLAKKSFVGRVDFNKPVDGEKNSKMEDGPMRKWWFAEASLDSMKA
ncbi:hypothetical protein DACRYDRAFT_101040 [Dacryopinax primogenitus]|uniref:Oxidized purine nucleoside triphosphate hydrolase n=1 Tax=Dacryopinax primogenitus (strain DJM 731) TaxID=1858805 RepID=M5FW59_DACPD|nr:uncharacterized protein DACRYDRAFT_101040 [Dacryopinax primogenitus]EJT99904.1 hypothetical protein DACRYDRAFT_101040 [Dacryopinax primogenitus]